MCDRSVLIRKHANYRLLSLFLCLSSHVSIIYYVFRFKQSSAFCKNSEDNFFEGLFREKPIFPLSR